MCELAFGSCPASIEYIPQELITREMSDIAVKFSPLLLRYVPRRFIHHDMCLRAVRAMGPVLEFVPEEFKTHEICLEAVRHYGRAINSVPFRHMSSEVVVGSKLAWHKTLPRPVTTRASFPSAMSEDVAILFDRAVFSDGHGDGESGIRTTSLIEGFVPSSADFRSISHLHWSEDSEFLKSLKAVFV